MPHFSAAEGRAHEWIASRAVRLGSLVLSVFLLAVTAAIGYLTITRLTGSREIVVHTYEVRGRLKDLCTEINELQLEVQASLLGQGAAQEDFFDQRAQAAQAILNELKLLTADNVRQQERLMPLETLLERQISDSSDCLRRKTCSPLPAGATTSSLKVMSGRRLQMISLLKTMEGEEEALLAGRLKTWRVLFYRLEATLAVFFAVAALLLFYNFRLLFEELAFRKQSEARERENADSYRALSARILELQDIERRKIARDLHDSVGQYLAGLKMNLGQLQRREATAGAPPTPLLLETADLAERAITDVRTISHLLHPPLLDELGLYSAVRWYVEGFAKRSGIKVELELGEIVDRLPREIELALFRVLQESLTNVHRHAKARCVDVELDCKDDKAVLVVRDDGKGLSPETLHRYQAGLAAGIGLAGMRERLQELRGSLIVRSGATGTEIRATLPTNECVSHETPPESISIPPG